ncbi:MAG: hypothetical protein AAGG81_06830 [Chlamydiota bacterium]
MDPMTANAISDEQFHYLQGIRADFASGPLMKSTVDRLVDNLSQRIIEFSFEHGESFVNSQSWLRPSQTTSYTNEILRTEFDIFTKFEEYWNKLNLIKVVPHIQKDIFRGDCLTSLFQRVFYLTDQSIKGKEPENIKLDIKYALAKAFFIEPDRPTIARDQYYLGESVRVTVTLKRLANNSTK